MKSLIFLIFLAFASSQIIKKRLIDRTSFCKGGELENGKCKCPNNTAFVNNECTRCIDGSIIAGKCNCPKGKILRENKCEILKVCSEGYIRLYNNTCIKRCPSKQIRVGNNCVKCPPLSIKIENLNACKIFFKKKRKTF